jgi:excisionase family DNA binding protein
MDHTSTDRRRGLSDATRSIPHPLLRIAEAAERLAISRSRAYALAKTGDLPGVVRIGGSIRVSARRLEEWIDRQTET